MKDKTSKERFWEILSTEYKEVKRDDMTVDVYFRPAIAAQFIYIPITINGLSSSGRTD